MNQPIDDRLVQMEALLLWEGRLNRARICDLFGVKDVRASNLIKEFREAHPAWSEWDSVTRSFHATFMAFEDVRKQPGKSASLLALYLTMTGPQKTGIETAHQRNSWAAFPDIQVPKPEIFSVLAEAIRTRQMVKLDYMSMREPEPHTRYISPHSLVQAGRRWHVRAFSQFDHGFRDYVLGRITTAKIVDMAVEQQEADDLAWNTIIDLRIVAHPALTTDQQRVIQYEYFMNTSALVLKCRACLAQYCLQDLRVAVDDDQQPPQYQLSLFNRKEVNDVLAKVNGWTA